MLREPRIESRHRGAIYGSGLANSSCWSAPSAWEKRRLGRFLSRVERELAAGNYDTAATESRIACARNEPGCRSPSKRNPALRDPMRRSSASTTVAMASGCDSFYGACEAWTLEFSLARASPFRFSGSRQLHQEKGPFSSRCPGRGPEPHPGSKTALACGRAPSQPSPFLGVAPGSP